MFVGRVEKNVDIFKFYQSFLVLCQRVIMLVLQDGGEEVKAQRIERRDDFILRRGGVRTQCFEYSRIFFLFFVLFQVGFERCVGDENLEVSVGFSKEVDLLFGLGQFRKVRCVFSGTRACVGIGLVQVSLLNKVEVVWIVFKGFVVQGLVFVFVFSWF